jgi:hypothetical protein
MTAARPRAALRPLAACAGALYVLYQCWIFKAHLPLKLYRQVWALAYLRFFLKHHKREVWTPFSLAAMASDKPSLGAATPPNKDAGGSTSSDASAPGETPVKLSLTISPPSVVSDENLRLRSEIQHLEQRVSREAQTWAEQRAALVREREELRKELAEKEAAIWKLMNGEVTLTGGPGQLAAKRKATAGTAAAAAAAPAKKAPAGASPSKAKAGAAKPGPKAAAKATKPTGTKPAGKSPPNKGKAASKAAEAGAAGSSSQATAAALAAQKQAEVAAAAAQAVIDAEAAAAKAKASRAAAEAAAAKAQATVPDGTAPSAMVAMVSAASAMLGGILGAPAPAPVEGAAAEADAEPAEEVYVKPPKLGFRPRPAWMPQLADFRRAMVRSPRRKKGAVGAPPGANGKKPPGMSIPKPQQQNQAQQAKKLVAQMGGVNGFAPKPGAKPPGAAAGAAKPVNGAKKPGVKV